MITACITGLVRVVGKLTSAVICFAEFIYFLLFSGSPEKTGDNKPYNPYRPKPLISGASYSAKGNSDCNPYRFKNVSKLTVRAVGFIFFIRPVYNRLAIVTCKNHSSAGNYFSNSGNNYSSIYPENYHSSTLLRNDVTRKLFANLTMQNLTTCL